MPAEALSGQAMLGGCRRSVAAAWRALGGRLAPNAATVGDPLLASGRRAHRLEQQAWLSVKAAAATRGQAGDWRRQAAAAGSAATTSPSAVAAGPAHTAGLSQQPATQQTDLAHLRELSEEQLAAVTAPLGTVRVVAGPGSGKTRVLTHRIAHLIHAHGAQPWQVLAITFTNKAANEMKERLGGMLGAEAAAQLFAGTFHSLCYRLLKRHIGELEGCGRTQAFTVFDQDMSGRLLAQLVRAEHKDWKGRDVTEKAGQLQHAISGVKNSMLMWHAPSAQAVERLVEQHLVRQRGGEALSAAEELQERELVTWFGRYEQALRQNNALDFDDLLGQTVALLRSAPAVRERYLRQFRHVCVDEFQDTNTSQYELVKLLTLPRADLFVVGDPDQSIYGWRGADMTNMTHAFGKDYPQAQIHALRDNYRSCARIVATAERVIAANKDWERAGLRPKRPAGHPIEVHMLRDSYDEARHIASEIQQALRSGEHPEEQIAVLFRTHIQARLVEQELVLRNISYVLVGGVPFWRRVEVQDVMAYLRLAVSLRDDVALARIINTPRRGLGDTSIEKLHAAAAAQGVTLSALLFGGAAAAGGGSAGLPQLPDRKELGLTPKAAAALEAFRELMLGLHGAVASQPLGRALKAIIDKTGYEKHVQDGGCSSSNKEGDEQERLQRLGQLLSAADEYEPGKLSGAAALDVAFDGPAAAARVQAAAAAAAGVAASAAAAGSSAGGTPLQRAQNFLDEAALYSGVDEGGEGARGVRLMTMHAAKGLEFELVFIPGCNDGLVPLLRGNSDSSSLSEERRLFYVSLTRAKQRLRLSHTRESNHYGSSGGDTQEPSRFLMDVVRAGHAVVRGAGSAQPGPARQRGRSSWDDSDDEDDYGERQPPGGRTSTTGSSTAGRTSSGSGSSSSGGGSAAKRAQQRVARRSGSNAAPHGTSGSSTTSSSGRAAPPGGGSAAQSSSPPPPLSSAQQKAQRRGGRR